MALGTLLRKDDLRWLSVAQRDIPKGAIFQRDKALGRALLYPAGAGEPLTISRLSESGSPEGVAATIEPGFRAVSVAITDTSGAAGLIQPNSRVDVIFTRPGSMAEAITSTILQNVKVLSIGRAIQSGQAQVDTKTGTAKTTVATLVVTPEMAQKLELAKNEGKISLVLRNPLDQGATANPGPITTEVLDPMVSARLARARKGRTTKITDADLDDPKVWQNLTGERKPKDEEKARAEEEARRKKEAFRKTACGSGCLPRGQARSGTVPMSIADSRIVAALAAALCLPAWAVEPVHNLALIEGRGELLQFTHDIQKVAVSEPRIADAVVLSPRAR